MANLSEEFDIFSKHLIGHKIDNFPYPEKFCPYCEYELNILKVVHNMDYKEHYKAIYICDNPNCEVFDEEAKKFSSYLS